MSQLILYDLPSKDPRQCWSYNPWKTRLVLNYKKIDYKTVWTEYPDIEPTLKDHVPPNPEGMAYSIPTVQFPDGTYIMDSKAIAARLEKDYPTPSLHLDSPILGDLMKIGNDVMMPLRPIAIPGVYENVIRPESKEYFKRTREERVGKPLLQWKKEQGGEEAWMEAMPGITALGELLKKNEGPFVEGDTPTYADFVIVGCLQFFKAIDEENLYQRLVKMEPAVGKLYEASKPWLERNDH